MGNPALFLSLYDVFPSKASQKDHLQTWHVSEQPGQKVTDTRRPACLSVSRLNKLSENERMIAMMKRPGDEQTRRRASSPADWTWEREFDISSIRFSVFEEKTCSSQQDWVLKLYRKEAWVDPSQTQAGWSSAPQPLINKTDSVKAFLKGFRHAENSKFALFFSNIVFFSFISIFVLFFWHFTLNYLIVWFYHPCCKAQPLNLSLSKIWGPIVVFWSFLGSVCALKSLTSSWIRAIYGWMGSSCDNSVLKVWGNSSGKNLQAGLSWTNGSKLHPQQWLCYSGGKRKVGLECLL